MRSYKKLSAYRKHISRGCTIPVAEDITTERHPSSSELSGGDTYDTLLTEQCSDPGVENPTISQQWHDARFILGIKEQHVISQAHIISTTTLVSTLLDNITAGVHSTDPHELLKVIEERVCDAKLLPISNRNILLTTFI
jgi:hypothetical protein